MTTLNQVTPIPISSLPNATTLTGNEALVIVQGNASVQVPINTIPTGFGGVTTSFSTGGHTYTFTNGILTAVS